MPSMILQELEFRISRLKRIEDHIRTNEEEKKCIQSRRLELESMRSFISEKMDTHDQRKVNNFEFWKLIDEF